MDSMKVCIYYKTIDVPWGGGNQFLRALKQYLHKQGIYVTDNPNKDVDLILINGASSGAYVGPSRYIMALKMRFGGSGTYIDINKIKALKEYGFTSRLRKLCASKRDKKIVYRLDGYAAPHRGKMNKMDEIQLSLLNLVDYVIFQSQACVTVFSQVSQINVPFDIVFNGVNHNIFNLDNKTYWSGSGKIKLFSCSWSPNLNKGYKIIAEMSEIENVEVYFVGNWPDSVPPKNVRISPPMPQDQLANEYKKCDVLLFPSQNDACSNTILEALSCGLPVIYHNSGGNPEIASNYGVALGDDIEATLEQMKADYWIFVNRIQQNHHTFLVDFAAEKYLEVFRRVLGQ